MALDMSSTDDRTNRTKHAIKDALEVIKAQIGDKDPDFLFRDVLAGLMKSADYNDRATLGNNNIDWALDSYVAGRVGEAADGIADLHQFLVDSKATPGKPFDFESADRYGVAFANSDDFKSFALMTQNYTYMIALERTRYYIGDEVKYGWNVHIRRASPGRHSSGYSRPEFTELGFLNDPGIVDKYENDCDYFKYHDGRDHGYMCSVTRELIGGQCKTENAARSFSEFQGLFYDMMCHVSMIKSMREEFEILAKPAHPVQDVLEVVKQIKPAGKKPHP